MWYVCLFIWNICLRDIFVVILIKKFSFYIYLFDLDKIMFIFWELDIEGVFVVRFYNYNFFYMFWLIFNNDLVICKLFILFYSLGIKLLLSNIYKMVVKVIFLNCWNFVNFFNFKFYIVCIKWKIKMDIMF